MSARMILSVLTMTDGTDLLLDAFVEAVITRKQPQNIAEEGYYASVLCLLGDQALQKKRLLTFQDEFKINYLNHRIIKWKIQSLLPNEKRQN